MDEPRYKILFDGLVFMEIPEDTVKANLARLFKCDLAQIDSLFNGKTNTLKRGLTAKEANQYLKVLGKAGAIVCKERETPDKKPVSPLLAPAALALVDEPALNAPPAEPPAPETRNETAPVASGSSVPAQQNNAPHSPSEEPVDLVPNPSDTGPGELHYFSLSHRIGRIRFTGWYVGEVLIMFMIGILGSILEKGGQFTTLSALLLGGGLLLYALVALTVSMMGQSLHDINPSVWWGRAYVLVQSFLAQPRIAVAGLIISSSFTIAILASFGGGGVILFALLIILGSGLMLLAWAFMVSLMVQRLHDINLSGWWALPYVLVQPLMAVPGLFMLAAFAHLLATLFLILKAGSAGNNNYGPPPPPNSSRVTILGGIGLLIFALGFLFTFSEHREMQKKRQKTQEMQKKLQTPEGRKEVQEEMRRKMEADMRQQQQNRY